MTTVTRAQWCQDEPPGERSCATMATMASEAPPPPPPPAPAPPRSPVVRGTPEYAALVAQVNAHRATPEGRARRAAAAAWAGGEAPAAAARAEAIRARRAALVGAAQARAHAAAAAVEAAGRMRAREARVASLGPIPEGSSLQAEAARAAWTERRRRVTAGGW